MNVLENNLTYMFESKDFASSVEIINVCTSQVNAEICKNEIIISEQIIVSNWSHADVTSNRRFYFYK